MRSDYPLAVLCETLGCNRSSFYYESQPKHDHRLEEAIAALVRQWPTYGYRRVTAQLKRQGIQVNAKRVLRVMRRMGLTERAAVRKVRTTDSGHGFPRYPNLLFDLEICRPDQVWVADITYVHLLVEDLYLAVLMDVCTRAIRGWNLWRGLDASLTLGALQMALRRGTPQIHHSDQGVQYACRDYVDALPAGVQISMAEVGQAWQNGHAERVIRTIKEECIELQEYEDYADARRRIGAFLQEVYNRKRIHSSLGYVTPSEYEAAYHQSRRQSLLTATPDAAIIPAAGETEAGSAEEQPARDSRLGKRRDVAVGAVLRDCPRSPDLVDAPDASENLPLYNSSDFSV
jgi:transposase InsO family protein